MNKIWICNQKWVFITLNIKFKLDRRKNLVKVTILTFMLLSSYASVEQSTLSTSSYFLHLRGTFNSLTYSYSNEILMASARCNAQSKLYSLKTQKIKICPNINTYLSLTKFLCKYAKVLLENKELGGPVWLSWVRLPLLISPQVMIS